MPKIHESKGQMTFHLSSSFGNPHSGPAVAIEIDLITSESTLLNLTAPQGWSFN